jgi:hypothetical protein
MALIMEFANSILIPERTRKYDDKKAKERQKVHKGNQPGATMENWHRSKFQFPVKK